jgi:hypothetical protein
MKKNFLGNLFLSLTLLSFTIWIGSYITRHILFYQLFEPLNLELRSLFNPSNIVPVIITITPAVIINLIFYPLFLIFFFLSLFASKIKIKNEGWLFIIIILILVTAPFEFYLSSIDLKIVGTVLSGHFDPGFVISLVRKRMTELSSFSLIEIFSFLASIFIVIFKPLRKNEN